jgi:hypothetical protein
MKFANNGLQLSVIVSCCLIQEQFKGAEKRVLWWKESERRISLSVRKCLMPLGNTMETSKWTHVNFFY